KLPRSHFRRRGTGGRRQPRTAALELLRRRHGNCRRQDHHFLHVGLWIVFFRFPMRMFFFWMIFITLMLPVEVRILPTYKVIVDLGMIDTYAGLTLPLMASATATFLFRQFFLTIPGELVEAARIDNAGPFRFMRDILLPLSKTNIAALFVILFIYGWTQYLWPLLVTNDAKMNTIIIGLRRMVDWADASTPWNYVMVTAILAIIPPILVVVLMQRWFVKGLVETEK
ncbi:LOW QUALITY PROTEIN: sn-glycerol-3-phosphate transport system permease ugpE, partial [Brucella melitensis bv. 1 str. Rev.1]